MENHLKWISSDGGPLILLEESLLSNWGGCFARKTGDLDDGEAYRTDYERASAIEDYVGVISVGSGYGLVLGDEPMQTSWLPLKKEKVGMLVRWQWASDEGAVIRSLTDLQQEEELWHPRNFSFLVENGPLLLFDAASPGTDIPTSLAVELEAGEYSIDCAVFQPNKETSLIVHRLRQIANRRS
jgi:hypothetical protein